MSNSRKRNVDEMEEDAPGPQSAEIAGMAPVQSRRPPPPGIDADRYFRDLYATDPDFRQLGQQDQEFGQL